MVVENVAFVAKVPMFVRKIAQAGVTVNIRAIAFYVASEMHYE